MESIRVELQIKNAAYFALLDDFNERLKDISDIEWRLSLSYHEREELLRKEFREELKNRNIPDSEFVSEECEMVYVNYDAFNCVLLHKDGTYTQHSLSEVKLIR